MSNPIVYKALFGGNDLSALVPGMQIYNINPYTLPHRTLNIFPLARRSARKLSSAFYDAREVSVSFYITQPTRAALDQSLDLLYSLIQGLETPLIVPQSGGVRLYTATFDSFVHNNPHTGASSLPAPQGGFIDMTLNFQCSDSYGYDTTYTLINNQTGLLSNNVHTRFTQGGGADTQVPFLQVQFTALSGATNQSVTIGNLATGVGITVTRTWSQYDILQIDCRNKTVQVNGVDVNFTGTFPEFALGLQILTYADTFTTRTFNYYAYVYNRWN